MRILAVTADAPLLTALTSMMLDWEIAAVREPAGAKEASEGASVALVASGTTVHGIQTAKALWEQGVTLPCLVIGDVPPPDDARVRVLVRPFNLHDLTSAIDEVAQGIPIDPRPAAAPHVEPSHAAAEAETALAVAERPERVQLVEPAEAVAAETPAEVEVEAEGASAEELLEPETAERPEDGSRLVEEIPLAPVTREAGDEVAVEWEGGPELEQAAEPRWPEVAPEHPRAPAAAAIPSGLRKAERGREGRRRFLRRRGTPAPAERERAEDPMLGRLREAIAAARELEALVHELPVLAQSRAMAHAFLGEVVEMFAPQVASVYAPCADGNWAVIAGHGLSTVEAGMKVPPEQSLFLEMSQTLEAVLIAPVDLAQGLVAGIGGARTEALLVAPLSVGGACHAIVVVGRQDFSEFDLELLAEQADEAAPGLAVAQMIDRLRSL